MLNPSPPPLTLSATQGSDPLARHWAAAELGIRPLGGPGHRRRPPARLPRRFFSPVVAGGGGTRRSVLFPPSVSWAEVMVWVTPSSRPHNNTGPPPSPPPTTAALQKQQKPQAAKKPHDTIERRLGPVAEAAALRRRVVWARAITLEDQQRKEQDHLRGAFPCLLSVRRAACGSSSFARPACVLGGLPRVCACWLTVPLTTHDRDGGQPAPRRGNGGPRVPC